MEGWARFEQRARQRRIERRLDAAQTAIRAGRLADARAALEELQELDPSNPHIHSLSLRLAQPGKPARSRYGSSAAAVLAFAAVLLTASWFGSPQLLAPNPLVETTALAPPPPPLLAARQIGSGSPIATSGALETLLRRDDDVTFVAAEPAAALETPHAPFATLEPPRIEDRIDLPPSPVTEPLVLPPAAVPPPQALPAPIASTPAQAAAVFVGAAPGAVVVDDAAQVREVLQKYRAAYERLDARSVHAVWPGVNESALARAFEGLESQSLTFKACDVQLRGSTAAVACTGSARYVAKIGSQEPRVEPLAWNFTLRKNASEWQIESARAER
jgi:hypothetical protein